MMRLGASNGLRFHFPCGPRCWPSQLESSDYQLHRSPIEDRAAPPGTDEFPCNVGFPGHSRLSAPRPGGSVASGTASGSGINRASRGGPHCQPLVTFPSRLHICHLDFFLAIVHLAHKFITRERNSSYG